MKNGLIFALCLMFAAAGFGQSGLVELNGLVSLADEKLALLTLKSSGPEGPASFMLSEGQSRNGVKLLRVDMVARQAEVEQDGVRKTILIAAPSKLTGAGAFAGLGINPSNHTVDPAALAAYLNGAEAERIKSGAPVVAIFGGGAGAATDNRPGNPSGTAPGSGSGTGSSGSTGNATDPSQDVWYQESLNLEQARLANAQDVTNGLATPWPRTPLTPKNTPASLIGPETYFGNQIPNWVPPGSPEPLPEQ